MRKRGDFTDKEIERIRGELEERGATLPCPRCGADDFVVTDGYAVQSLQRNKRGITIGENGFLAVGLVCMNCGYVSNHALGVLGLI